MFNTMKISSQQDLDGNDICEFMFGDDNNFANKIVFNAPTTVNNKLGADRVVYASDIFKKISRCQ